MGNRDETETGDRARGASRSEAGGTVEEGTPWRDRIESDLWWLLFAAVLLVTLRHFVDPDLGGHLAYGLDHFETGHLARFDGYSYTANGLPWVNHEWAFEWLLGAVYSVAGPIGLSLLQVVLWGGAGGMLLVLARRSSRDVVATGILYVLFAATLAGSMGIRPQLATYFLFAVLLLVLEKARAGHARVVLAVPPLFALWVNVHGGFVAGLGVLGLYAAGLVGDWLLRRSARGDHAVAAPRPGMVATWAAASVPAAAIATLANPYGTGLWRWMSGSLGRPRPQITEWLPIGVNPTGAAFAALAIVVAIALIRRSPSRTPLSHVLVLAVTCYLAMRHVRHIPFFTMSAVAFVPGAFSDVLRGRRRRPESDASALQARVLRAAMAIVVVAFLLLQMGWPPGRGMRLDLSERNLTAPYPTGAFEYIERNRVAGNMIVFFDWAQLVIFRYYPRIQVAYDGRFRTVYPAAVEEAYLDFFRMRQPGWRRLLDEWPTEWVLVHARGDVSTRLRSDGDWWLVYEDGFCALFRRALAGVAAPAPERRAGPGPVLPFRPPPIGS